MATNQLKQLTQGIAKTPEAIRAAAEKLALTGNTTLKAWADSALVQLKSYDERIAGKASMRNQHGVNLADRDLERAFGWVTGALQPYKAAIAFGETPKVKAGSINDRLAKGETVLAMQSDGSKVAVAPKAPQTIASAPSTIKTAMEPSTPVPSAPTATPVAPTIPFKAGLTDAQKSGIQALVTSGRAFNETDAKNFAYATGNPDWQSLVGKTGAQATGAPGTAPSDPSVAGLFARVEATNGALVANKDFVNAAFKAYTGRDASAEQLAKFVGHTVDEVRAGLKTGGTLTASSAPSAAVGDRRLGPSEFEALRKQFGATDANFDQFFRRDAQGNIYLRADAFSNAPKFTAATASIASSAPSADELFQSGFDGMNLSTGGDVLSSFVAGLKALWDGTKSEEQTRLENERADLLATLKADTKALAGKGAAQAALEEKLGLTANTKSLQEINRQIAQKMGEYDQADFNIRQQPITTGLIQGEQRSLMEQKAIDLGVLFSMQAALQGNITLAQQLAEHTVDLQFAPIEAEIKATQAFLDVNGDDLTRAESRQASTIQSILDERSRVLDEQKADKRLTMGLMLDVAKAGGDPRLISFGKSYEDNLAAAAPYLTPPPSPRSTQVIQVGDQQVLVDTQSGERIATYGQQANVLKEGGSISWRNNNPLNIKFGDFAAQYGAVAGSPAQDGGVFANFPNVEAGFRAARDLLRSKNYASLGVDAAMKRWSNNGYGADVTIASIGAKTVGDLSDDEIDQLIGDMMKREGWTEGTVTSTAPVSKDIADKEMNLRKEFTGLEVVKQFGDLRRSYNGLQTAYDQAVSKGDSGSKAAADQALVTLFNKMLDPGSVVREGEYARTSEGQSAIATAQGTLSKLMQGGAGITDETRKDMVDISQKLFASTEKLYTNTADYYTDIAVQYGLDPNRVITPTFVEEPAAEGQQGLAPDAAGNDAFAGLDFGTGGTGNIGLGDLDFSFGAIPALAGN